MQNYIEGIFISNILHKDKKKGNKFSLKKNKIIFALCKFLLLLLLLVVVVVVVVGGVAAVVVVVAVVSSVNPD